MGSLDLHSSTLGAIGALFALGLLGSGHCIGMCGPLVVAFPGRRRGFGGHAAYHLGRLCTYTLIGSLLGGLGVGLAEYGTQGSLVWTARIQIAFSLLAALFLALFGLSKLGFLKEPELLSLANPARIPGFRRLQRNLSKGTAARDEASKNDIENDDPKPARAGPGVVALFFLGLLLGLLPCGLSFAAFARALGAHGMLTGAIMTLAFGLGTLPSLLIVGASASRLSARHRRLSDLIAGMLMIGMAAALILEAVARL